MNSVRTRKTHRGRPRKKVEPLDEGRAGKRRFFTDDENELIKRMHAKLVQNGLSDKQICKKIGKELGRSTGSVDQRIRRMRKDGEIRENPNKGRKDFSTEELRLIKRRYNKLVQKGLKNAEISRRIGKELGRSTGSLANKMRQLRRTGEFADVETLREREDILGVVEALEEFGEEDG